MTTQEEMVSHVQAAYREKVGDNWNEYLNEQANLVYIRTHPNEGIEL